MVSLQVLENADPENFTHIGTCKNGACVQYEGGKKTLHVNLIFKMSRITEFAISTIICFALTYLTSMAISI